MSGKATLKNYILSLPLIATLILLGLPLATASAQEAVAERFRDYYQRYQGMRVLGPALTGLLEVDGFPAQYFEKARLEDHSSVVRDVTWQFMFGRLTDELMRAAPEYNVSGTGVTYAELAQANRPEARVVPPAGFTGGTAAVRTGRFIPYDSQLNPAPGYIVPLYFWNYMNRSDLFPYGWLHAIGLPMSDAFQVQVVKNGAQRTIMMQAFERTVLTYDPQNPANWQVERGNLGIDAVRAFNLPPPFSLIEIPAAGAITTLPLHIQARVGQPGSQVNAILRWADGTELTYILPVLRAPDGTGIVVDSIDWETESEPPQPTTTQARLELRSPTGNLLAQQPLTVLSYNDPNTQLVSVYFLLDEQVYPSQRRIVRTPAIGRAALEELLWGPGPRNFAGFTTAIPTPREVLSYPGREPNWGVRVRLLDLTIENGVAFANFSPELRAYGGGSTRVRLIREQITRTLQQFPSVREVRIAIAGQTEGVLEP